MLHFGGTQVRGVIAVKKASGEYEFRIDAFTPASIPMSRLAEYMQSLASLLGEPQHVHFKTLRKGSTCLVHCVDRVAEPKVMMRLKCAGLDGETEGGSSIRKLNALLAEDNASGLLSGPNGVRIIAFPGCKRRAEEAVGPVTQPDVITGIPIMVGGSGTSVSVHLQNTDGVYVCHTGRKMAKEDRTVLVRAHDSSVWNCQMVPRRGWHLAHASVQGYRIHQA